MERKERDRRRVGGTENQKDSPAKTCAHLLPDQLLSEKFSCFKNIRDIIQGFDPSSGCALTLLLWLRPAKQGSKQSAKKKNDDNFIINLEVKYEDTIIINPSKI